LFDKTRRQEQPDQFGQRQMLVIHRAVFRTLKQSQRKSPLSILIKSRTLLFHYFHALIVWNPHLINVMWFSFLKHSSSKFKMMKVLLQKNWLIYLTFFYQLFK